jgi:hypothetical protein
MMHLTLNNGVKSLLKLTLIPPCGTMALLRLSRHSPLFWATADRLLPYF